MKAVTFPGSCHACWAPLPADRTAPHCGRACRDILRGFDRAARKMASDPSGALRLDNELVAAVGERRDAVARSEGFADRFELADARAARVEADPTVDEAVKVRVRMHVAAYAYHRSAKARR